MTPIEVTGLALTYPGPPAVAALRGVDLRVEGGLLAVVGPSGCGKTTLLRALAGTERPEAGTIAVGGEPVEGPGRHLPAEARQVTLVPQEGALFPHLDVAGNVGFGLRGLDRRTRRQRVAELLDLVGLPGSERRRPHQLSGGQQQRVALARALAPRPRAVLLDEPFSALDATLRVSMREEVVALLREASTTAVLVTHDRDEALSLADRVAVMHEGRVLQVGEPSEVYRRPSSLWVARLLGETVVVAGRVAEGVAETVLGRLPVVGAGERLVLRPEQVVPARDGAEAVVERVRFRGPEASVALRVGDTPVTARWASTELPAVGDRVRVGVRGPVVAVD